MYDHYMCKLRTSHSLSLCGNFSLDLKPVEAATMEAFVAVFGKFGLPNHVIFPTYGLAEHTVFVSSHRHNVEAEVDKIKLESDRIVSVIEEKPSHTRQDIDETTAVTLVGCGSNLNYYDAPLL
eukprot:gene24092-31302_t